MLAINVEANVGALKLRVDLPAAAGTTVVVGPNGAGKSTLLKSLLGAIKLRRGRIQLGTTALFCKESKVEMPMEERKLGYVPQRYALFPHMTVEQNVAFGIRGCKRHERRARVSHLLGELGIDYLARRKTSSLSGGESQRVALARALAIRPRALLLDEPMAALDAGARRRVRRFLVERLQSLEIPTLIVSHDVDDVEAFGGRIAVIENGTIVQTGALDELRKRPASPFVANFLRREPAAQRPRSMTVSS